MKIGVISLDGQEGQEEELFVKGWLTLFCYLPNLTTYLYNGEIMTKLNEVSAVGKIEPPDYRAEIFEMSESAMVFILENDYQKLKEKIQCQKDSTQ